MATYTVKLNLMHDGEAYEPGAEVELDEKAAAVLVKDGVVEDPNAAQEASKPEEAKDDAQPASKPAKKKGGKGKANDDDL